MTRLSRQIRRALLPATLGCAAGLAFGQTPSPNRTLQQVHFPAGYEITLKGGPQGLTDNGLMVGTFVRTIDDAGNPIPVAQQKKRPGFALKLELAVDANRDGLIKFPKDYRGIDPNEIRPDITSQARPFRFWCNDDDDHDDKDHPGSSTKDSADNEINSERDLEDFVRLHLYIGGLQEAIANGTIQVGLEWRNVQAATSPSIKVYRAAEGDGGNKYLTNDNGDGTGSESVAKLQIRTPYKDALGTIDGGGGFKFPLSFWQWTAAGIPNFDSDHPTRYILFEGVTEGKGQLVVTFWKGTTKIGEGGGCWIDLKNIKRMYVRGKGTPESGIPHPWNSPSIETNYTPDPNGFEFEKPFDETQIALVYVHGIYPPFVGESQAYLGNVNVAETVFKRLWHAGFKGRLAFYKWPAINPISWNASALLTGYFNESEWRGFQYGRGLYNFMASQPMDYKKHVYAHSQGNAVVAAAFRDYSMPAQTWIITQGAIPISCFDVNAPNFFTYDTPDLAENGGYRGFLNQGLPARILNFYNEEDQVTGDIWEANQGAFKPSFALPDGIYNYKYKYNSGQRKVAKYILTTNIQISDRDVTNLEESMSMLAQSKTKSIAHGSSVSGVEGVDLTSEFSFGDEHGSQWDRGIQNGAISYFERLVDEIK